MCAVTIHLVAGLCPLCGLKGAVENQRRWCENNDHTPYETTHLANCIYVDNPEEFINADEVITYERGLAPSGTLDKPCAQCHDDEYWDKVLSRIRKTDDEVSEYFKGPAEPYPDFAWQQRPYDMSFYERVVPREVVCPSDLDFRDHLEESQTLLYRGPLMRWQHRKTLQDREFDRSGASLIRLQQSWPVEPYDPSIDNNQPYIEDEPYYQAAKNVGFHRSLPDWELPYWTEGSGSEYFTGPQPGSQILPEITVSSPPADNQEWSQGFAAAIDAAVRMGELPGLPDQYPY